VLIGRMVSQSPRPILPVPTVTTHFSLDGTIESMASDMWVVGGSVVYLDASTQIQGTPSIGNQAHIEGDIESDSRRIARSIKVTGITASTATVEADTMPTRQPTMPAISGLATVTQEV